MQSLELIRWSDLASKGFVVVPQFLSNAECEFLCTEYKTPRPGVPVNDNYDVTPVRMETIGRYEHQLREISRAVLVAADIDTDITNGALFFATARGISFPWHQDHETYYFFQDHRHYLNFYIPIVKPDPLQSNVCVIPFDALLAKSPELGRRFVGGGAKTLLPNGRSTVVCDDETERQFTLPFDIETIAETPKLSAGDLLLLRGDMIHRTQDTNTDRVAISFRRQNSKSVVVKERLVEGGRTKRDMLQKNRQEYDGIMKCFATEDRDCLTVGEILNLLRPNSASD